VWLRNVSFLSAESMGTRADAAKMRVKQLTGLIGKGLPDGHVFVITADDVDKRSAFYKSCVEHGQVQEFSLQERMRDAEKTALERIGSELEAAGLKADTDIKIALRDRVGMDSRQIANEITKLVLYLGNRRQIEASDIQAIISPTHTAIAWDLADAFGTRDAPRALMCLRQLVFQKEEPMGLIVVLENRLKELLFLREALDKGWVRLKDKLATWGELPATIDQVLSEDLPRDPRQTHPYRTGILIQQAARYTRLELLMAQRVIMDAHERLLSSSVPEYTILELMLVRLISREALTASRYLR
jgi:DNA polymerase III delta subunit